MGDWYAASLVEIKAFLDQLGEEGVDEVTVSVGDDIVAALVGVMDAAVVTSLVATHVAQAGAAVRLLDPQA